MSTSAILNNSSSGFFRGLVATTSCLLATLILNGCVIIINQPSVEEKELMAIQQTVGNSVSDISGKISSGQFSGMEINDFIAQAQNTLNQAIQRIDELKIPDKTKQFAEETKKYLVSAQEIFNQLKTLTADFDKYKEEGIRIGQQAGTMVNEQMKNIQTGINNFSAQLDQLAGELESARKQIEETYNQTVKWKKTSPR
jgi:DNA repair exonuclease SbcCD ATPase subunit